MTELECPVCNSHDVTVEKRTNTYSAPYGPELEYTTEVATCSVCGESGDFNGVNTAEIEKAVRSSDLRSVEHMLNHLDEAGFSMAYLERALRLPARTMARWKTGQCSASGLALLRLLRTFPWLAEVAESGFDQTHAKRAALMAGMHLIDQMVTLQGMTCYTTISRNSEGVDLNFRVTRSNGSTPNLIQSAAA